MLERLRPFDLGHQRHVGVVVVNDPPARFTSAAVWTKLSATRSTPIDRPNCRSSMSFSVTAEAASARLER